MSKSLIDQIELASNHLGNIHAALHHYEKALNKAYPNGAPDNVWQYWNLARIYLFEPAPKKEGEKEVKFMKKFKVINQLSTNLVEATLYNYKISVPDIIQYFAVDKDGIVSGFEFKPYCEFGRWHLDAGIVIEIGKVEYEGDWENSLVCFLEDK